MKYQKKISKLRHAVLKVQGQDLQQVLIRAAAKKAEFIAAEVHSAEEIFHELKERIYNRTNEMSWDESFNIVSDAEQLAELKKELIEDPAEPFAWAELRHLLLEGLEDKDVPIVQAVLDNEHNYLAQARACGGHSSYHGTDASLQKILIPIVRRLYGDFPIRNIVGVQPMTGPVGLAYTLQFRVQDPETGEYVELSEAPLDDETPIASIDGEQGRKMRLEVISQAVEAGTRNLQAGWTVEASQDLSAMLGLDIEAEMVGALAEEIRSEFSYEVINDLKHIAGEVETVKLKGTLTEQAQNLCVHINRQANEIARKTRRGAGNFMIVSPLMSTMFKTFAKKAKIEYVPTPESEEGSFREMRQVGTLNGFLRVYESLSMDTDEILVGYKGGSGETDTGYIHCPYVPLMSSGVVLNPNTYEPVVSLMTRYGKTTTKNASDYYRNIKVKSKLLLTSSDNTDPKKG